MTIDLNARTQLYCVYAALAGIALIGIGFWPLANYLPPPHANDTAQEIADFYRGDTTGIRAGLVLCFIGTMVWGPLVAVITKQMLRIEPRGSVLPYLQLLAGGLAWVFITVPLLVLSAAAFRPDRSPETTQTIHDLGWFLLFMPVVPFIVQTISIGIAALQDKGEHPVFARWVGYFNLWCAVLFAPGIFLTFFKTGPLSYQGVLVYWVPLIVFFIWWAVMCLVLRGAILREPAAQAVVPAASRPAVAAATK
jgi:hypothetical protein